MVKRLPIFVSSVGAALYAKPKDYGWMYQHSFADPDGHKWELAYMDVSQLPAQG